MADVRSLLQKEREARRIAHPHLAYTKAGILTCTVCHLNVKAESLWEGHLKSANHRKNLQLVRDRASNVSSDTTGKKRKIDDVEDDTRKKTKSERTPPGEAATNGGEDIEQAVDLRPQGADLLASRAADIAEPLPESILDSSIRQHALLMQKQPDAPAAPDSGPAIDEDEWAAFEREVVPMTHEVAQTSTNYEAAIISAAPMSAAEAAAQHESDRRSRRELEAEDEKEEEERRMEDEFEIMEEMEERVRKLKEKREALRNGVRVTENQLREADAEELEEERPFSDEEDDADAADDWYS